MVGGGSGGSGGLDARTRDDLVATCTAAATAAMLKATSKPVSACASFARSGVLLGVHCSNV